jgi:hypothetical protein
LTDAGGRALNEASRLTGGTKERDMGLDDLVNQGKGLYEQNKDKIDAALKSEQAEGISDSILDTGAGWAKKIAPDEHDAKVDGVREDIDRSVGSE